MTITSRLYPALAAVLFAGAAMPALAAQEVSNAELLRLIKAQAAEIKELKQRLSAVEGHNTQGAIAAEHTGTTAVAAGDESSRRDAQVGNAIADTRESEMAVALARGNGGGSAGGGSGVRWGRGGEAGPTFRSDDGFFTFKPDGRLLFDVSRTSGSNFESRNITGSQVTSARLGGEGTIGALGYHVEADFADNEVALRQTYLTYTTQVFGQRTRFYLGNFLKDLGTEGSSESARVPFMLRNAATAVGQPVVSYFGLGAQMRMWGDGWHASLSISGNSPNSSTSGSNTDSTTYLTRAHWNPVKGARRLPPRG